jgi:signal transduction histidine kinase
MLAGWQRAAYGSPGLHVAYGSLIVGLAGAMWMLWRRLLASGAERDRERRGREEMEAYTRLDARMGRDGDVGLLGRRVCSVVAARSAFGRVAMLARDAEGSLYVAASEGMDAATVAAVETWAARAVERERGGGSGMSGGVRLGARSLVVPLGEIGRAVVVPLWTTGGRLMGALVVRADSVMQVRRRFAEEAVAALEALGMKLGRAMENAELAERLLRAEKLAGLGMLAGGVAHALNNPLTAVLGYAELIRETTTEPRVRRDAGTIVDEAKRMRETVQRLLEFWRPPVKREESVNVGSLVRELAKECEAKLESRGVRLMMQVAEDAPAVRGSRERLRQMLEHLLNNAAQAIGAHQQPGADGMREDAIRVTVGHDARAVQMIVSDTGPGFREPGRVFDLFYTTQAPGQGDGLGLSICYGIVREHGGEISAFNLHPRGAAVVVELPIDKVVREEHVAVGEVA